MRKVRMKVKFVLSFAIVSIISIVGIYQNHQLTKQNETINNLKLIIQNKDTELKEFQHLERMLKDLSSVPKNAQPFVLGLCFTESSLNYNVKHKGKYDKSTTGICGIKPDFWKSVLKGNNPNSLYSGYLVLNHLLEKHGDIFTAIAKYKGAKRNLKTTEKAIEISKNLVINHY